MLLVANKVDLVDIRKITDQMGQDLASSLKVSLSVCGTALDDVNGYNSTMMMKLRLMNFVNCSFLTQLPYIETSAINPALNVDEAFHEVVRVIRRQSSQRSMRNNPHRRWICSVL